MDRDSQLISLLDLASIKSAELRGKKILVGLSGGADSVALLRALKSASADLQVSIEAVHVNHRLRASADNDEQFAASLCQRLEIPLHLRRLQAEPKPSQKSPEQHWKQLRYAEYQAVLQEISADYIALGHTADDLAETFLFHIARGTGLKGLVFSFASFSSGLPVIRPLWRTKRTEIEAALLAVGQDWVTDPTNKDTRYSRNLIRHEVMPVLARLNPVVVDSILSLSDHLREVNESLNPNLNLNGQGGTLKPWASILSLHAVTTSTDPAREIRDFVTSKTGRILDRRQTEQALGLIRRGSGTVSLAGAKTLVITQTHAWLYDGHQPDNLQLALGHVKILGGLYTRIGEDYRLPNTSTAGLEALDHTQWTLSWPSEHTGIVLRNRRPGDRIGSKPLSRILLENKVPWYLRDYVVVLTSTDGSVMGIANENNEINQWISRHRGISFPVTCIKSEPSA